MDDSWPRNAVVQQQVDEKDVVSDKPKIMLHLMIDIFNDCGT